MSGDLRPWAHGASLLGPHCGLAPAFQSILELISFHVCLAIILCQFKQTNLSLFPLLDQDDAAPSEEA